MPRQYLVPYAIANASALVLLALALIRPQVARGLSVALFAWAACMNAWTAWKTPAVYLEYADLTPLPAYRDFILGWFSGHVIPMVWSIAAGQAILARLLASTGQWRGIGVLGAIVFLSAIAPLGIGSGFPFSVTCSIALVAMHRKLKGTGTNRPVDGHTRRSPGIGAAVVLCLLVAASSPGARADVGERAEQISGAAVIADIQARLSAPPRDLGADEVRALVTLYASGPGPVWTDNSGRPTADAAFALELFDDAPTQGLLPEDYEADRVRRLLDVLRTAPSVSRAADVELALSAAVLRYFDDVHLGRVDPGSLGLKLHVPRETHDMGLLLRSALAGGRLRQAVDELTPPLAQYRALQQMLVSYRRKAADPAIPAAPTFATTLRPGDGAPSPDLRRLSDRLRALGDLPSSVVAVSADVYADPLVSAVRSFQVRHGLEPDGVIGRATMAALAVPLARRVTEIEFSLERLRWLPDFTNARVIAVNIPTFQLFAWEATRVNGVPAFSTRAIVGKAMRTETPVFVEELNEVVFRPFWNIPRSILRGEILPALAKNSGYLAEHGMDIVDGPGDEAPVVAADEQSIARLRAGTLRLRQRPGPANALGLVKFVLPNDDNVYLHGTPAPALFGRARRDFSHGCVRVDDPASLAEWVLAGQGWTRERIAGAMQGTRTQRVRLARPIQIVLFYLTAAVAADGTMHFADDIYGHDQRLASVLARPRPTSRGPS